MLFDRSCTHALVQNFSVSCCSLERGTIDRACIRLREPVHLSAMFLLPPCVSPCIRVQISVSCCLLAPVVAVCAHACIRVPSSGRGAVRTAAPEAESSGRVLRAMSPRDWNKRVHKLVCFWDSVNPLFSPCSPSAVFSPPYRFWTATPRRTDAPPRDRSSLQLRKRARSAHASQRAARQTRRSPKGNELALPPLALCVVLPRTSRRAPRYALLAKLGARSAARSAKR